jgi:hypothetical protein
MALSNGFTDWLNLRAAEAGLDISRPDTQPAITVLAAMAAEHGLTPEHTATIAEALHCTPAEVEAAYRGA